MKEKAEHDCPDILTPGNPSEKFMEILSALYTLLNADPATLEVSHVGDRRYGTCVFVVSKTEGGRNNPLATLLCREDVMHLTSPANAEYLEFSALPEERVH